MMASKQSLAIQSISWRGIGAITQLVLGFAFTLILMRFISPEEYGVVAKIYIVISLFNVFLDFGFSHGIIQSKNNTREFLSSHFFISLFIALFLAIILSISAKSIATFYEVPELKNILYALSFNLISGGAIIIHRAYMHKKLKFKQLSIINLIAFIISGITAIFLAYKGYSFYAIVVQLMLLNFIQVILILIYSGFKPMLHLNFAHIRKTTSFSLYIFFSHFIIYISEILDQFLSSIYFSQDTLGKYNRSISITRTPVKTIPNTLNTVLFPLFSHAINEEQVDKNESIYVRSSCIVFHLIAPLLVIIFFFSTEIVSILLPDEWLEISVLIKILSIVSLFMILELEGPLFLSKGKSKQISVIVFINKFIRIVCIFIGIQYGLIPLLFALLIAEIIMRVVHLVAPRILLDLDLKNYFKKLSTSILFVSIFAITLFLLKLILPVSGVFLISVSILIYVIYLLISYRFKIGQAGKDFVLLFDTIIKKNKSTLN